MGGERTGNDSRRVDSGVDTGGVLGIRVLGERAISRRSDEPVDEHVEHRVGFVDDSVGRLEHRPGVLVAPLGYPLRSSPHVSPGFLEFARSAAERFVLVPQQHQRIAKLRVLRILHSLESGEGSLQRRSRLLRGGPIGGHPSLDNVDGQVGR